MLVDVTLSLVTKLDLRQRTSGSFGSHSNTCRRYTTFRVMVNATDARSTNTMAS